MLKTKNISFMKLEFKKTCEREREREREGEYQE
jgi:hypothetical protein